MQPIAISSVAAGTAIVTGLYNNNQITKVEERVSKLEDILARTVLQVEILTKGFDTIKDLTTEVKRLTNVAKGQTVVLGELARRTEELSFATNELQEIIRNSNDPKEDPIDYPVTVYSQMGGKHETPSRPVVQDVTDILKALDKS